MGEAGLIHFVKMELALLVMEVLAGSAVKRR
jgi:hypothetical protein